MYPPDAAYRHDTLRLPRSRTAGDAPPNRTIRPLISRVFWVQCVLAVTVAAAAMPFGRAAALSALVGGINSLVPTAYFAHKVLRAPSGAAASGAEGRGAFGAWMRAEVAKIAIVCGLFVAAFILLKGLDMAALFTGFIVVHVGGVLASLTLDPRGGGTRGSSDPRGDGGK